MKRLILILVFSILSLNVPSTCFQYLIIPSAPSYSEYDRLIRAVVWVESRGDNYALNVKEQAIGAFQIRACRVQHYNRLRGTNYSYEDFFDYELSREMFLYFAQGKNYEKAARNWNGSGKKTIEYWKQVKTKL